MKENTMKYDKIKGWHGSYFTGGCCVAYYRSDGPRLTVRRIGVWDGGHLKRLTGRRWQIVCGFLNTNTILDSSFSTPQAAVKVAEYLLEVLSPVILAAVRVDLSVGETFKRRVCR